MQIKGSTYAIFDTHHLSRPVGSRRPWRLVDPIVRLLATLQLCIGEEAAEGEWDAGCVVELEEAGDLLAHDSPSCTPAQIFYNM
jgi:hypothetical protein